MPRKQLLLEAFVLLSLALLSGCSSGSRPTSEAACRDFLQALYNISAADVSAEQARETLLSSGGASGTAAYAAALDEYYRRQFAARMTAGGFAAAKEDRVARYLLACTQRKTAMTASAVTLQALAASGEETASFRYTVTLRFAPAVSAAADNSAAGTGAQTESGTVTAQRLGDSWKISSFRVAEYCAFLKSTGV